MYKPQIKLWCGYIPIFYMHLLSNPCSRSCCSYKLCGRTVTRFDTCNSFTIPVLLDPSFASKRHYVGYCALTSATLGCPGLWTVRSCSENDHVSPLSRRRQKDWICSKIIYFVIVLYAHICTSLRPSKNSYKNEKANVLVINLRRNGVAQHRA